MPKLKYIMRINPLATTYMFIKLITESPNSIALSLNEIYIYTKQTKFLYCKKLLKVVFCYMTNIYNSYVTKGATEISKHFRSPKLSNLEDLYP